MSNRIKRGMLNLPKDKLLINKPKVRALRPWEKMGMSTNIPKCVINEQMRKMTIGQLKSLSDIGARLDG